MSVVNCKVKYIRPEYQDLSKWLEGKNNVYIGRRGVVFVKGSRFPKQASPFANPFRVGKQGDRKTVIAKYEAWLTEKLEGDEDLQAELLSLDGKTLGCWCHPEACHGDVLLKLIKKLKGSKTSESKT
jgi:hypothetical protein